MYGKGGFGGPPCGGGFASGCAGMGGKGMPHQAPGDMDWICNVCRENNFSKKPECFKCKTPRSFDSKTVPARTICAPPSDGTTVTGMVKSYNKKGFGFLMCFGGYNQDVYFTRENVSSKLLHPDMPGEQVSFEVYRERGKLVARNVRTLGEGLRQQSQYGFGKYGGKANLLGPALSTTEEDEDRSWICPSCKEHNFSRRFECFKCKMPRPLKPPEAPKGFSDAPKGVPVPLGAQLHGPGPAGGVAGAGGAAAAAAGGTAAQPRRTFSPHAGARAIRESLMGEKRESRSSRSQSSSRRGRRKRKKRHSSSSSSERRSSSSSSAAAKKHSKAKKHKKKAKRHSSHSSSCEEQPSGGGLTVKGSGNPKIDKAKQEALQKLLALREIEAKETRMSEWRALLRQWHPDKNLDNVEVATAVFQFLQKGKDLMSSG